MSTYHKAVSIPITASGLNDLEGSDLCVKRLSIYGSQGTDSYFKTISMGPVAKLDIKGEGGRAALFFQYAGKGAWGGQLDDCGGGFQAMIPWLPPGACKHRSHPTPYQSATTPTTQPFFAAFSPFCHRLVTAALSVLLRYPARISRTMDAVVPRLSTFSSSREIGSPGENAQTLSRCAVSAIVKAFGARPASWRLQFCAGGIVGLI